jgi:hypothetical protein
MWPRRWSIAGGSCSDAHGRAKIPLTPATLATASGEARAAVLVEAVADGGSFSSITIGDGGGPDDYYRNILERRWTQSGTYEDVSIFAAVYAVSGTTTSTGGMRTSRMPSDRARRP